MFDICIGVELEGACEQVRKLRKLNDDVNTNTMIQFGFNKTSQSVLDEQL